jgi:hypothetical protein
VAETLKGKRCFAKWVNDVFGMIYRERGRMMEKRR